jgi:hypothetical protein
MDKIKNDIALVDRNNNKFYRGTISYHIKRDGKCGIELKTKSQKIFAADTDCFEALNNIRERIYPLIPLINGTRIDCFPSIMSRQMSKGTIVYHLQLGKQAEEKDQLFFLDATQKGDEVGRIREQNAFHALWISSLGVDNYEIDNESYVLIEKIPKYIFDPHKRVNENYDFFWVYDKEKNYVYDIASNKDINSFKNNLLKPEWNSFKEFFKWYTENYA